MSIDELKSNVFMDILLKRINVSKEKVINAYAFYKKLNNKEIPRMLESKLTEN